MIKRIVFDCSDTLLRFSALDELSRVMSDAPRAAVIKGKIHQSQAWHLYDRGQMTEENLRQEILPLFDEEDRPFAAWYLDNWLKCYWPIPDMPEIVRELQEKGWPLYMISDFPPCFNTLKDRFHELFSHFQGIDVSCECGAVKGDKSLFAHFLQRFAFDPAECVFIDDVPRLVDNACSMGFQGIVFEHAHGLRERLAQLKVL